MKKSIHSQQYAALLKLLIDTRKSAGITQVELAARLGATQSFVSKCERGERRLDIIELREFVRAINTTLPHFVRKLENVLRSVDSE